MLGLDVARDTYLQAAFAGDRPAAATLAAELLASGHSPEAIILGVLAPAQERVGERWMGGQCSVGREHLATWITQGVLSSVTVGFEPATRNGHIVLACCEGELHDLPARMAAELLALQGWQVTCVGTPLPAVHLASFLDDLDPDVVALSCTIPANLLGAARSVAAAQDAGATVLCGGRAFGATASRARAIGADGWVGALGETGLDLDQALFPERPARPGYGEWDVAEQAADHFVAEAVEWIDEHRHNALPEDADGLTRLTEQLRFTLGFAAAAALTDDLTVLHEHRDWLLRRADARALPARTRTASLHALAAVTAAPLPRIGSMLAVVARG